MVEHLNLSHVIVLCSMSLAALAPANSLAEDLPDPTRPPVGFGLNVPDATPVGPVLQSILISPTRRVAIISGKSLKVGDKFGEAQLTAISDNEVVLKTGKDLKILRLYPSLRQEVSGSGSQVPMKAK